MTNKVWDVVVVGAGPAGAATAMLLARQGRRVALLERASFPRPKACAEYMSPGVAGALERLGLAARITEAKPCKVPGMDIIAPSGATLPVRYERDGQTQYALTLPRLVLDALLAEEAAQAGAEIVERFTARSPLMEGGVVRGVEGSLRGQPKSIRGEFTVIADGARSVLAKRLDMVCVPRWPLRLGLVAHYHGSAPLRQGFGQMHVHRHGYCGVAPLPGNQFNVAIVVRVDSLRSSRRNATAFFERWIADRPRLRLLLSDTSRIDSIRGVSPVGARARRLSVPGAVLIGDAAGFFDPFTGEGIYRALRGAELLVGAMGSQGLSPGARLHYERSRRTDFGGKEAVTSLVQMFVQFPRLLEYAVPRLLRREKPATALSLVLGDIEEARAFLRPNMLWAALRP